MKLKKNPARFGLIWFSGSRGEDLNVIFYQNMPNLHNRYISAERKISQKNPEYMLNYTHSRWLLLLKIEISSNGQNCPILSQNVPKFELYKHNEELFSIYYRINRYISAERKISQKNPEYMLNYTLPCSCS
jgi:RNase P subunit RPR2